MERNVDGSTELGHDAPYPRLSGRPSPDGYGEGHHGQFDDLVLCRIQACGFQIEEDVQAGGGAIRRGEMTGAFEHGETHYWRIHLPGSDYCLHLTLKASRWTSVSRD